MVDYSKWDELAASIGEDYEKEDEEGKEEGDQRRAERVEKKKTANMQRRCIHEGRIQEIAICRNRGENRSDGA